MLNLRRRREDFVETVLVETYARKPDICAIGDFHNQQQIAIIYQAKDVLKDLLDSLVGSEKKRALPTMPCGTQFESPQKSCKPALAAVISVSM